MEADLISLFAIVAVVFICPLVAALIPNKLISETVFLLIAGMIIGPNVLNIAQTDAAISLLSDIGLGLLFLLAGYEINPKELAGRQGRYGFATWIVTFAIAIGICLAIPASHENPIGWLAVAIALTTTAFGTLVPILHEQKIAGTALGNIITNYGVWGEICPIIAIALILSSRQTWLTLLILGAFALLALTTACFSKWMKEEESRISRYIGRNRDANTQMIIRAIMVLLIGLLAVSAVFDLDIVLGAFAAGFIVRYIVPAGDKAMEYKLNSLGYGFFIPLFFVVSGMGIDPRAVAARPILLILFIISLVFVRALPIFISLRINRDTRQLSVHERLSVALYCTTALPLIVAVTTVAINAGAMSNEIASLLIAAGGISVFIMPLGATLTFKAFNMESTAPSHKDGSNGANPLQ